MKRLVRLNEVQYTETEEQAKKLIGEGFHEEPLTDSPTAEQPKGRSKKGGT